MASTHKYRGNLAETTLPAMLFSIDRFQVPGMIEATRGEVVKRVFVRQGYIVHASSTNRQDSLGAFLERTRAVPRDLLVGIAKLREDSNKRLGVMLLERGILSPVEVLQAIRQHLEEIVWSLFYWDQGLVTFGIGELEAKEIVQIQLPIRQVIVEGIKRAPDPKPLLSRLGDKQTVLEPCYELEDLIETGLDRSDHQLLRSVDGKKSLYELCGQGPRTAGEIARTLYAFQVLHLVRPKQANDKRKSGPVKIKLGAGGKGVG